MKGNGATLRVMSPQDEAFAAELEALHLDYTHLAEGEFQLYAATESEAESIKTRLAKPVEFDVRVEPLNHALYSHTVQVVAPWCPWTDETGE